MQHAWAVQSHQYGYETEIEGDANILKQVVSGILNNMENLWELVKKSTKNNDAGHEKKSYLNNNGIAANDYVANRQYQDFDQLISDEAIVKIKDFLKNEIQRIKKIWEDVYKQYKQSPNDALVILESMEKELNPILSIGILSIKHGKINILNMILRVFN